MIYTVTHNSWAELHLRDWIASLDEKEDNTDA